MDRILTTKEHREGNYLVKMIEYEYEPDAHYHDRFVVQFFMPNPNPEIHTMYCTRQCRETQENRAEAKYQFGVVWARRKFLKAKLAEQERKAAELDAAGDPGMADLVWHNIAGIQEQIDELDQAGFDELAQAALADLQDARKGHQNGR